MTERRIISRPVGHDSAVDRLDGLALAAAQGERGGLAHAFLMVGPGGVGKFHTACWWAARLLCDAPERCDLSCPSCRRVGAGSHPDLTVVEPSAPGKQMGIDDARQLIHAMSLKPVGRGPRVAIVRDAQLLTLHAQSAMLKLLEEPPGFAVIVLVTENPSSLLATLRSRCQIMRFGTLQDEAVVELLMRHGRSAELARQAAAVSAGSIGRALDCTEDGLADRAALLEAYESYRSGDTSLDALLQELLDRQGGEHPALPTLLEWQMEKLESSLGCSAREESDTLESILQSLTTAETRALLDDATRIHWTLTALERRANPRLAIRDMLLDMRDR